MSVGQREKATQKRVIKLFVQELGYTYLGDFTERKNSNIETDLLTKFLTRKGYSPVLISRALKELQDAAGDQSVNLYDLNEQTYKKLRYGVKVSESVGQHMPASTPKEQEAVAETIENNIGKEIVERTQSNPKYYENMSALLCKLIEKRKNDVINYEEYLRQIVELARKVHKPESSAEYPPGIRESAAKRAFYDHLGGNSVAANQIYDAVMSSKQDNFRGSKIKERKIWRAIRAIIRDSQEADRLLALVKEQSEF